MVIWDQGLRLGAASKGCEEVHLTYMMILFGIRLGPLYMGLLTRRVSLGGAKLGPQMCSVCVGGGLENRGD